MSTSNLPVFRKVSQQQLTITLPQDDLRRVDALCQRFEARRTEMIRELVRRGLDDLESAMDAETSIDRMNEAVPCNPISKPTVEPTVPTTASATVPTGQARQQRILENTLAAFDEQRIDITKPHSV